MQREDAHALAGREGWADVGGERWRVRQPPDTPSLQAGERVQVTGVDGLTLEVRALPAAGAPR